MSKLTEQTHALVVTALEEYEVGVPEIIALGEEMKPLLDLPDEPTQAEFKQLSTGLRRVVSTRTGIEKSRKRAVEPADLFKSELKKHADLLTAEVQKIEVPLTRKKEVMNDYLEKELQKETLRVQKIQERLDAIQNIPVVIQDMGLKELIDLKQAFDDTPIIESDFEEFLETAVKLRSAAIDSIQFAVQKAQKAEDARLAQEFKDAELKVEADRLKKLAADLDARQKVLDAKEKVADPPETASTEPPVPNGVLTETTTASPLVVASCADVLQWVYKYLDYSASGQEAYAEIVDAWCSTHENNSLPEEFTCDLGRE